MHDKNVIVLGTGCSAAQFVPHLTKAPFKAKSVTQLMRSPPWVEPKLVPVGGEEGFAQWGPTAFTYIPGLQRLVRYAICSGAEGDWLLFGTGKGSKQFRAKREKKLLDRMKQLTPKKYHEMLTPNYEVGCKRRIYDAAWYKSLHDPKIELTTMPLTSIQEGSVTLGPGTLYPKEEKDTPAKTIPADVIVLANGFEATHWLHPLKITGVGGKDLIESMGERGGPQAYLGTAFDGFPNFLMIYGPNTTTGHSSVVLAIENGTDYAMKLIKPVLRGDVSAFDIKKSAEISYTNDIQAKLKDTVFMTGGCNSWYFKDGWNSTTLP
jgi:cation diffusion facilitator CzcD-associated flavoprotein CzcO